MGDMGVKDLKRVIYSEFADIAKSVGYSEVHGRIIAALFASHKEMTLQQLAKETGHSPSSISVSLDLLEALGMVSKYKKANDRRLYVRLDGDLLDGLRKAIILKTRANITNTLDRFKAYEENLEKLGSKECEEVKTILDTLRKEMKRLDKYLEKIEKVEIPE